MASVEIKAYEIAQLFGLEYIDWDYNDPNEGMDKLYNFRYQDKPFIHSDGGYQDKDDVLEEVAKILLMKIGSLVNME